MNKDKKNRTLKWGGKKKKLKNCSLEKERDSRARHKRKEKIYHSEKKMINAFTFEKVEQWNWIFDQLRGRIDKRMMEW